ncbi:MAG: DUF814 domain-containing protein [Candidatus Eremiobacteraeota bacterium]|nr:DUF814 domain-containing protein [Candidatus Eremiobacteraeota bacterium]
MVTDHLLIRRAALELDAALRGLRLTDLGLTEDGKVALVLAGRGARATLVLDPFGTPPLIYPSAQSELSLAPEPGWLRAAGTVLRGLRVAAVKARRGDRVLMLEFGARSRFGVATAARLIVELVPRFGNIVVLKDDLVVAAAKTFSPAENPERSIELGARYAPPPLRQVALPRLLRDSSLALAELEELAGRHEPVHVYRRSGTLVQAHVVALSEFGGLEHTLEPDLLPLFAEASAPGAHGNGGARALERRRELLSRNVRKRFAAVQGQLEQLAAREAEVGSQERERLRAAGDAIYAHLGEIAPGASLLRPSSDPSREIALDPTLDAKTNAAAYFARYRKAVGAEPQLAKRRDVLERERSKLEILMWEIERADADALAEIEADLTPAQRSPRRRAARAIEPLRLASGARIYVGRSPRENVAITFTIARPDDLWFHAKQTPGAHVVLVPASGSAPSDDEIERAAALAAGHSKARASARVDVDYTQRKYVRKQRDAAPGMVWYTDFKTVRVVPADV